MAVPGTANNPLVVDTTTGDGMLAGNGRKTVTSAGTALALAASTACKWVVITALPSNTDKVSVGRSTTLAAAGSESGVILSAGDKVVLPTSNLILVFVDSRVSGEGVSYAYGV